MSPTRSRLSGARRRIKAKDLGRDFLVVAHFRHLSFEAAETAWSRRLYVAKDEQPLCIDPKGRGGDARFSLDNHDRPAEQPGASDRFVRDKLRPAKERFNALCLQGSEDKAGRDEPTSCSGRLIQRLLLICVGAGAERPQGGAIRELQRIDAAGRLRRSVLPAPAVRRLIP